MTGRAADIEVSHIMEKQHSALLEEQLFNLARKAYQIKMVRGYAHELNNLLTGILGYSQLLLTVDPSGDMDREQLKDIESSAQRSRSTIRQLSRLWRNCDPIPGCIDVKSSISSIVSAIRYHSERKSMMITQEYIGGDILITAGEEDFEDAFYSLLIALVNEGPEQSQLQLIVEKAVEDVSFTMESPELSKVAGILISAWSGEMTRDELLQRNIHLWVFLRLLRAMSGDIKRHGDLKSAFVISIPVNSQN